MKFGETGVLGEEVRNGISGKFECGLVGESLRVSA